jgi:hypothetical protein
MVNLNDVRVSLDKEKKTGIGWHSEFRSGLVYYDNGVNEIPVQIAIIDIKA